MRVDRQGHECLVATPERRYREFKGSRVTHIWYALTASLKSKGICAYRVDVQKLRVFFTCISYLESVLPPKRDTMDGVQTFIHETR
jgi:hypothetical protein